MPLLTTTTLAVRKWELLLLSLRTENIYEAKGVSRSQARAWQTFSGTTHILVTGVCEYNDWEAAQRWNRPAPSDDTDRTPVLLCVASEEMEDHEYDQVSNRDEGNNARILKRI